MAKKPKARRRPSTKSTRRRPSTKLVELKSQAKRDGWLKWLRSGAGEEADERALLAGCWFDVRRGEHWAQFVANYGTLTEGAWRGQRFELRDWQHAFGMRLFGWLRYSAQWQTAVRRFRFAYCEVPKKNGKTPFAAVTGNYLLIGDSYGRQVNLFTGAPTRATAQRLNVHAERQIKNNDELAAACQIRTVEGFKEIHHGDNVWKTVAADINSSEGVNGSCIGEEFHLWRCMQFYNSLRWALATQIEGLFLAVTTAGMDTLSPCGVAHTKTKQVNDGQLVAQDWLGEIYAADKTDDLHDPATWRHANPSLGDTPDAPLKLEAFREDHDAAKDDPTAWPDFKQKRLGIWRSAEDSWLDELGGIELWDAGQAARKRRRRRIDCFEPFTLDDLAGELCDLGVDTASIRDTCSAVFSFTDDDDPDGLVVRIVPRIWLPRRRAEEIGEVVPYEAWEAAGFVTLTDGDALDFDRVKADIVELGRRFRVRNLYFDPRFQSEMLTQRVADELGATRVEVPQNYLGYAVPCKQLEALIIGRRIRHNGNAAATWQLGHTKTKTNDNNEKRPIKQKRGDHRAIDFVCALLMSISELDERSEESGYYDDEDNPVEWI